MTVNETHKMEALLHQLSKAFTTIPFNQMLGLELTDIQKDQVAMSFCMKQELIGNFLQGILHGGVISSVLDMAGGMAVMTSVLYQYTHHTKDELIDIISKTSTVDLQISYLRPGRGEQFTAKAWIIKSGKKISFTRMELSNQDNILIATGTGTYLINAKSE